MDMDTMVLSIYQSGVLSSKHKTGIDPKNFRGLHCFEAIFIYVEKKQESNVFFTQIIAKSERSYL